MAPLKAVGQVYASQLIYLFQVAIPIHMAIILSYPERVTRHNKEKLRQCVRNGLYKYPGARQVNRVGGPKWFVVSLLLYGLTNVDPILPIVPIM